LALMDPLILDFWVPVGVVMLCAGAIGFERQLKGKPVGIRTSTLICLGTMMFVQLSTALSEEGADPSRVLGQVVTGIGFLGAGVMFARGGVVTGVTTAAVIWVLAAIGAVIGYGSYSAAVALSALTVLVLVGVDFLERSVFRLKQGIYARESNGENHQDSDSSRDA
jgi:putative Mg2+ transporter-C (MgtC) family protein